MALGIWNKEYFDQPLDESNKGYNANNAFGCQLDSTLRFAARKEGFLEFGIRDRHGRHIY
jgi:hypothetical protein